MQVTDFIHLALIVTIKILYTNVRFPQRIRTTSIPELAHVTLTKKNCLNIGAKWILLVVVKDSDKEYSIDREIISKAKPYRW